MVVNELREARNSNTTLYIDFNKLKNMYPNGIIFFVEGKDSCYYFSRISAVTRDNINPIQCKGKARVKSFFKYLDSKNVLNNVKTLFFIDRDFDKNDEQYVKDNFYVTNRYAIENYYVTENCLKLIIKNELGISEANEDYNRILSRFRSFQDSYHHSTSLFNAWYYSIKNSEKECKVSLNDELPDGYLSYDYDNWTVQSHYSLATLNEKYAEKSHEVTQAEIDSNRQLLDANPCFNYRGKFELTCLIKFITKIQEELNRKKDVPGELSPNPYKAQISSGQVISLWAQYSECDEKLKSYIERRVANQ